MRSNRLGMLLLLLVLVVLTLLPTGVQSVVAADQLPTQLYLVGVGAGDPDLATLRAVNVMKKADLVFCTDGIEEFEDLHPQVVPGVSSFNAGNAALRKGATTSDKTKAVILSSTDWPGKTDTIEKLSQHHSSMVLFTMRAEFPDFIKKLSVNYPPETPVAIVRHAGYADKEEVIRGTLGTIIEQVKQEELPFEYLIYIGDFLSHRYKKGKATASDHEARDELQSKSVRNE